MCKKTAHCLVLFIFTHKTYIRNSSKSFLDTVFGYNLINQTHLPCTQTFVVQLTFGLELQAYRILAASPLHS